MRRNRLAQSSWFLINRFTDCVYLCNSFIALKALISLFCFFWSLLIFFSLFYYFWIFFYYFFFLGGGGAAPFAPPSLTSASSSSQSVCLSLTHRIPVCSLWRCSAELLFKVVILHSHPFKTVNQSPMLAANPSSPESGEMEPSETCRNPRTYEINTLQHGNCFVRFSFTSWEVYIRKRTSESSERVSLLIRIMK